MYTKDGFYWDKLVEKTLPTMRIIEENWEDRTATLITKEPQRGQRAIVKISHETLKAFGEDVIAEIEGGQEMHEPRCDGERVMYDSVRVTLTGLPFPKKPE